MEGFQSFVQELANVAESSHPVLVVFALFGLLVCVQRWWKFWKVLLQTFVIPGKAVKKYGAKNGAYALITGGTDGIGREFAVQLAKKGYNILLVSRNQQKLDDMAKEIETKHSVKTATCAINFAYPLASDYEKLQQLCEKLPVGILVNNVGKSHEMPVAFAETPLEEQQAIIDINVTATLRVTRIALAGMLQRRSGLVLTITSFAGNITSPLLTTYSASKAFLQKWSDGLQAELNGSGVDVECVSTHFVVSNMSKIRRPSALVPTPKGYVSAVLGKIGVPCGALDTGRPSASTPYWSHSILDYFIHYISWDGLISWYVLNLHKDIRKRALRKKERDAASKKE